MAKIMRSVLRANEVQFQGPLQLGLDSTTLPQTGPEEACPSTDQPQARIAEAHPEYALLELTCPCGKTTYVRCDYAPAEA